MTHVRLAPSFRLPATRHAQAAIIIAFIAAHASLLAVLLLGLLLGFWSAAAHAAPPSVLPARSPFAPVAASCSPGNTYYVDKNAYGSRDGSSWTNAFVYLQDALAAATTCPQVQQIWVAAGVYYPDEDAGRTDNDAAASFVAPPGLAFYGGFAGTEAMLTERSLASRPTILSGDVDGNDINAAGNFIAEATGDLKGANAYHVLRLNGAGGTPIDPATRIDGFTITGGYARGLAADDTGGGGLLCKGAGANSACSPTLANLSFRGNRASYYGGAIFADGGSGGASSPTLVNVVFAGNAAVYAGGAMYNSGIFGASSPALTNVTFYANFAGSGGALFNDGYSGASAPVLTNVILWGNTASSSGAQMHNSFAAPTLRKSLIHGGVGGNGIYNSNSSVNDGGGNVDGDPLFVAPAAGDLRLLPPSVARDAGDNDAAPAGDLRGLPRPVNGVVDIGAFEAQPARLALNTGSPQSALVNSAFVQPLVVTLSNPYEWTPSGAAVTFMPPPTGPGLTTAAPWTTPVDANGVVTAFVGANYIAGRFAVTATATGVLTPAIFSLTNTSLTVRVATAGAGRGVLISTPTGIVCAPLCKMGVDYGRVVTITASPLTGSSFGGWIGDTGGAVIAPSAPDTIPDAAVLDPVSGMAVQAVGDIVFPMTGPRILTATFTLNRYTVSAAPNPPEGGTVSGGGTFAYGTGTTVAALPNEGYRLLNWGLNGAPVTTTAIYSFTVRSDRTLVANFTALPTAVDDVLTITQGTTISIPVLANDLDRTGAGGAVGGGLTVITVTLPANGVAAIAPDAKNVTYTPSGDFRGTDTFSYTLADAKGSTATGQVTVYVTAADTPGPVPDPGADPADPSIVDQIYFPAILQQ